MKLVDFLSLVCPTGTLYDMHEYVGRDGKTYKGHNHYPDAAKAAAGIMRHEGRNTDQNIWFAVASFKHLKPNKTGKLVADRRQDNVDKLKALFADIDIKQEDGHFHTKREARDAIKAAIVSGNIPTPTVVVDSGNGIHIYWVLDTEITREEWEPYAYGFRDHLVSVGLKPDPTVTIDSARVLRPINTTNKKDPLNPKAVDTIIEPMVVHPLDAFIQYKVSGPINRTEDPVLASQAAAAAAAFGEAFDPGTDEDLLGGIQDGAVYEMEEIVKQCPQIASLVADNGRTADEPLWKASLLLAARCIDGADYAHTLSSGHKDYQYSDTLAKFTEQVNKIKTSKIGPTSCATFGSLNPIGCQNCPFSGRIKSPIILGKRRATSDRMPDGYRVSGFNTVRVEEREDGPVELRVCAGAFREVRIIQRPAKTERYRYENWLQLDYSPRALMTGEPNLLYAHAPTIRGGGATAAIHLASIGLQFTGNAERDRLVKMLSSWEEQLVQAATTFDKADTPDGWHGGDTFNVGLDAITAAGAEPRVVSDPARQQFRVAGTLDKWKVAAAEFVHAGPALQIGAAISFGAPLAHLLGLSGFMFSLYTPFTGAGKTTAMRVGASVWGNPVDSMFGFDDTFNSVAKRLGERPHFPAYWDEFGRGSASSRGRESVTSGLDILFTVAQGKEKARLNSDANLRSTKTWELLMAVGTNISIVARVDDIAGDATPRLARFLEINLPHLPPSGQSAKVRDNLHLISTNYGHAGRIFMQAVLAAKPAVLPQLTAVRDKVMAQLSGPPEQYRMLADATACVIVGAAIAKKAGLIDFDIKGMFDTIITAAKSQFGTRNETRLTTSDIIYTWLARNPRNWAIKHNNLSKEPLDTKLVVMLDCDAGEILIPLKPNMSGISKEIFGDPHSLRREIDMARLGALQTRRDFAMGTTQQRTGGLDVYVIPMVGQLDLRENAIRAMSLGI